MDKTAVMSELERLATPMMKKRYQSNGAKEPFFGVATGAMKPMSREIKINQALAEELYATGNYDAMYFAGVIADSKSMTKADYERWIDNAYFYMISDYVVAVTLSESELGQTISDLWINSSDPARQSAAWSCYCWMLGSRPDSEFDPLKISSMLKRVQTEIENAPYQVKKAMSYFIYTVATSFSPLHEQAIRTAKALGSMTVPREHKKPEVLNPYEDIEKAIKQNRLGFKRRYIRC